MLVINPTSCVTWQPGAIGDPGQEEADRIVSDDGHDKCLAKHDLRARLTIRVDFTCERGLAMYAREITECTPRDTQERLVVSLADAAGYFAWN